MKNKPKIAFQGEKAAYSEEAAFQFFGKNIKTISCQTFKEVFKIVEKEKADYGIIPVENSLEGSIGQNYDLLLRFNLNVTGEFILRIRHCLIAKKGVRLSEIKEVYSHPQALGQCREFLERLKCKMIPCYDTAGSVKIIKEKKSKALAAVASQRAASCYGLKVIRQGIETNAHNYTRFFIISKRTTHPSGNDKTSIVFSLKHRPGALFQALKVFADQKINLTKIESRPVLGKPWQYNFYVDFEGHGQDKKIKKTLKSFKKQVNFLKVIGSYQRAKLK